MRLRFILIAALCGFLGAPVFAGEEVKSPQQQLPTVPLMDVLESVSKKTGLVFAVDRSVDADVVVGQIEPRRLDYSTLLVVLRNNQMAAVEYENVVNVINVVKVRQYPLPVLHEKDDSVDDEQWVTMMVKVQNATAAMFVPILRPMLPQPAHLIAHPESNMLSIVGRYGNVKRMLELIQTMDYETTQQ